MKKIKDIQEPGTQNDDLSPLLLKLKGESTGIKVPEGYFDTLSPRIVDSINIKSSSKFTLPIYRKPLVWAPVMVTIVTAVLLIFVVPTKKTSTTPAIDEWTEIEMGYDASYAEEVLFAESYSLENEIENSESITKSPALSSNEDALTNDEISAYLKDQEVDIEMITEY
jgi:hypothetical protein